MPFHNSYIGDLFNELADILEIEGANAFRVRAYRNAARVVSGWPQSLFALYQKDGALPKLPGLGDDLNSKVQEIIRTGELSVLQRERKQVPPGVTELLKIPGLGPRRVLLIQKRLGIQNADELAKAAEEHRIRELPGLGEKTESRILQAARVLRRDRSRTERLLLAVAEQVAAPLLEYLKQAKEIQRIRVAGSFRRRQETVGDLDFLVAAEESASPAIMEHFVHYDGVEEVLGHGETKSSVRLRSGIQVDLRVVPEASFGAALHYSTGSKSHNIAIRAMGVKAGLKINEYGVFKGSRRIAGRTEEEVYAQVGLPYIEPELREARGEIEAAREKRLPRLVEVGDIRGDLHSHTKATDGRLPLEEMARVARALGREYLAISDHSRHLAMTRGLTPKTLLAQVREIDRLNGKLTGIRLLKSIEVDILEDGKLDLPDEVLRELDLTVCSIHSKFGLSLEKQTGRILRAMDDPYFDILGHPTGRLIGARPGYEVNLERIMKAAAERGCFLELNCQPERMDLSDVHCKMAKELGVKIAISTDAHGESDLRLMSLGVSQARRGWLEADDVINTKPWSELKKLMRRA